MQTNYAIITPFLCTKVLCDSLIESLNAYLYSNEHYMCADEIYTRTFDGSLFNTLDSTWILECFSSQEFHWHTFDHLDIYLSLRRILFVADKGLILSFFEENKNASEMIHEEIKSIGPTFLELKFDGRVIHRFRPLDGGRLFAYSFHYKDSTQTNLTLGNQSYIYNGEIPPVNREIDIIKPF